uniref:Uncharacterized protein n=1 Tax=Vitis vinifera TaxID=29760 RepID=F6HRD0_VITVI
MRGVKSNFEEMLPLCILNGLIPLCIIFLANDLGFSS